MEEEAYDDNIVNTGAVDEGENARDPGAQVYRRTE